MKSRDLTKGNIMVGILLFAIPVFIGNILAQLYNLTDTWVVGKYLEGGISSIGSCSGIYDLLFAFANGVTMGFAIVLARSIGEGNDEKRKNCIFYTVFLTLGITIFLTLVTCLCMKPILRALNTPEAVFSMAYTYIMVITAGLITTMLYNMFMAMMRSAGNSLISLICLVVSVLLNIGMDILFVVVFRAGIFGVALATVVAQALAALFCFIFIFFKMPELHVKWKDLSFDRALFKEVVLTGLSMGFMLSIVYIGTLLQQGAINALGEDIITAHTLARKVEILFMNPLSTMATAASTFAGQNYGANKLYRIKKGVLCNIILAEAWSLFSVLCIYTFGDKIVMLLGSLPNEETSILSSAMLHLRINIPFFTVLSILLICRVSMQSVGYKIVPSISSGVELLVKVLIAFVFASMLGYLAICIGEPIIWSLCAITLLVNLILTQKGRSILFAKRTEYDF